eukprot:475352_1
MYTDYCVFQITYNNGSVYFKGKHGYYLKRWLYTYNYVQEADTTFTYSKITIYSWNTYNPTSDPTITPTDTPTTIPTSVPTTIPTSDPTITPTDTPTTIPTSVPTVIPTAKPTSYPTLSPTNIPTHNPTNKPTNEPTNNYNTSIASSKSIIHSTQDTDSAENDIHIHQTSITLVARKREIIPSYYRKNIAIVIILVVSCICVTVSVLYCMKYQRKRNKKLMSDYDEITDNGYIQLVNRYGASKEGSYDFNGLIETPKSTDTLRTAGESMSLQFVSETYQNDDDDDDDIYKYAAPTNGIDSVQTEGNCEVHSDSDIIPTEKNTANSFGQILNDNVCSVNLVMNDIIHDMDTNQ